MVENPFGDVPALKMAAAPQRQKLDVCFTQRKNPPVNAMTYEEGMAHLKLEEDRFRKKYETATLADRARGAHHAAETYATLYKRCKRTGQKAMIEAPLCIETALAELHKDLGFDAIEREVNEQEVGPGDDEATAEGEAEEDGLV